MLCKVSFWNVSMKATVTREIFKVGSGKVGRFQWYCIHNCDWLIAALISEDLIVYDLFNIMIKLKVNMQFFLGPSGFMSYLFQIVVLFLVYCGAFTSILLAALKSACSFDPLFIIRLTFPFTREYHVCGTYLGGGVHHSIFLPWTRDFTVGTLASLAFTCIKSECLAHAWGGWGVAGVSNDWCTTYFIRTKAWRV